ncbi:response regulator [Luteitalea sp. TBR-22]|nr:response regulator [Luteitalea sp. TBR-22]BCS31995.1 response regulator [Luteitalea sp. TBR-22]
MLLVDDYPDAREMYGFFLARRGYRVEEAADGHEALDKALALRPQVILMDLSLPGIDGWELARMLKRDPRTLDIPIIALTAHALNGEEQRARGAGCDAFVTKPCLPHALEAEIARILRAASGAIPGGA